MFWPGVNSVKRKRKKENKPSTGEREREDSSYSEEEKIFFNYYCFILFYFSRGRSLHDITEYHPGPHDGAWVSAENGAAGARTTCVTDVSAAHILRLSLSALSPAPPPPTPPPPPLLLLLLLRAASETRAGKAAGRRMREAGTRGEIALTGLAPISLTQITGRAARQWVR